MQKTAIRFNRNIQNFVDQRKHFFLMNNLCTN